MLPSAKRRSIGGVEVEVEVEVRCLYDRRRFEVCVLQVSGRWLRRTLEKSERWIPRRPPSGGFGIID